MSISVSYTHYNMHNNVVIKNKIPDIYKNMNKLKLLRPYLHSRVLHSGYTIEAGAHLRQYRVLQVFTMTHHSKTAYLLLSVRGRLYCFNCKKKIIRGRISSKGCEKISALPKNISAP